MKRARYDDSQATIPYSSQGSQTQSSRRSRRSTAARRAFRVPRPVRGRRRTPLNAVYQFERTVVHNAILNLSSGWYARGKGISFAWSLDTMLVTYADGYEVPVTIPGSIEFINLFDQYRVDKVEMEMYFSASNHNAVASTSNTIVMPIMNVVSDWDSRAVTSGSNLLEYAGVRSFQCGQMNSPFKHTITGPAITTLVQTDSVIGQDFGTIKKRQWLSTSSPECIHNCIKVGYEDFGEDTPSDYSPDVNIGKAQFRFRVFYSLKNPK